VLITGFGGVCVQLSGSVAVLLSMYILKCVCSEPQGSSCVLRCRFRRIYFSGAGATLCNSEDQL
jgi:hypothetical protein